MRNGKLCVFAALLFFFLFGGVCLNAQNFPSLDASPQAHEYAERFSGNNVRWVDLAEVSLWASSVNAGAGAEAKAASYLERIKAAVSDLSAVQLSQNPKERGEEVLSFLHKNFLKSYSELQTRVDEIFISGRYNCVSSAILYMILCNSAGLEVEGVMTKDHAFVSLKAGTETIDVETTNRYGFDPGNRKEFQDAFGKATGFAYVPAKNYRDRVVISAAEMVSLILSNRIAVLEKGNRFAEAVPLAVNRAAFLAEPFPAHNAQDKSDFFEDPKKDMMNRLFNLGSYYIRNGKEDDAIAWAEYAGGRFPEKQRWQELTKAAANNKLVKLIRAKKTADARSALSSLKEKLTAETYLELDVLVLEAEAADKINGIRNPGDVEAALAFIEENWDRLPPKQQGEMRTAAILKETDRYGKTKNWIGGMQWLENAMRKYGSDTKLENAMKTMRQNRVGELHNEFAVLFNKKDYNGAKASVEKSLQEFPGEKQLLQDLALVEKALAR